MFSGATMHLSRLYSSIGPSVMVIGQSVMVYRMNNVARNSTLVVLGKQTDLSLMMSTSAINQVLSASFK